MEQQKARSEPHYYSDQLKRKLSGLSTASTAIVEAPSGYGKTTAVRDFLESNLPQSVPVHWFTATDELPAACFRRFARYIEKIDSHAGQRLLKIELPNAATIGEACDALRSLQCRQETWLVIDNFQYLLAILPSSFFAVLVDHGGESLHVILLTHMVKRKLLVAVSGYQFLHITAADLKLDAVNIRRYYSLAGVNITQETAKSVAAYTGGWIIAVYLQLRAYRERGAFSDTRDIVALMEHLVWSKLTPEQQDFFLRLSPFETLTVRQICALMGWDALPDYAQEALETPFIRYEPAEQRYEPHSILYEILGQKCRERGEAYERECLVRAGDLCRDEGSSAQALSYYWRIKEYERILSLDLSPLILETVGGTPFSAIALDLLEACSVELRRAYPLSMLRVAWALKLTANDAAFDALMDELYPLLDERKDELELMGEWLLLSSFRHHPHASEMTAVLQKAAPLFHGTCSRVILPTAPWCFSNCGPLGVYYTAPGEAEKEAGALTEYITLYSQLTGGHGYGADVLYRAELAYHRGDMNEAEILAYKAMFLAQSKHQGTVQLGVALQLAQIALHKANTADWQNAIASMERASSNPAQDSFAFRATLDAMRGMLLTELQRLDGIAGWLKKGDFSPQKLLPALIPTALFVHAVYLLHQGEYARLIGIIEARYPEYQEIPVFCMLLSLTAAAGYMQMGDRGQARVLVRRAGKAALPDGQIFPFASFSWLLKGLTDELIETEYPNLIDRFHETKERFGIGWTKLYQDLQPEGLSESLTEREREVALLAARGFKNSEIAKMLFITDSTVRTHLRIAFSKLDIDRRAKLSEKLKQL